MKHDELKEKLSQLEKLMEGIDKTDEKSRNKLSQIIDQIHLELNDQSDTNGQHLLIDSEVKRLYVNHPARYWLSGILNMSLCYRK